MAMIAKFRCESVTHAMGTVPSLSAEGKLESRQGPVASVTMVPVYHQGDPAHENSKFWAASPSGKFELQVVNLAAVEDLEPGAEYYLEIRRAD